MSIPPLVCSTPPPPDQCEDDRDPEDYDLQYNLSQDDDDDDSSKYDFGNFSTYSHYQSALSQNKKINLPATPVVIESEIESNVSEIYIGHNSSEPVNSKYMNEDINIEDLDLKLDAIEVPVSDNQENVDIFVGERMLDRNSEPVQDTTSTQELPTYEGFNTALPACKEDEILESPKDLAKEIVQKSIESTAQCESEDIKHTEPEISPTLDYPESDIPENVDDVIIEPKLKVAEDGDDDDFGDFEDFQFTTVSSNSNKTESEVIEKVNPWDQENDSNVEFGDFKANFEEEITPGESNENVKLQSTEGNDDDDFGDFNDFKSSTDTSQMETVFQDSSSHVPVLNFQSHQNEKQFLESINKVLSSIFEEEIGEPDIEFDVKLESLLGGTWAHLMETDIRQPYVVNWNNSLGQKTLLHALSIDSRNILFGPKWNSNTPKFAANMSLAPLQPQKQVASSNGPQTETVNTDRAPNKQAGIWTDPFTSDGQESSSNESESTTNSTNVIRPAELDTFEAAISSKSETKIYSSTINVQPIRQISLPDTHIFTPTDSETPRSKTIHYDNGPTVLLPKPVDNKNQSENIESKDSVVSAENDEYWEFKNYTGSSDSKSVHEATPQQSLGPSIGPPLSSTTQQQQILLPIKLEPIVQSVNWPEPGEVKETFDDFSEFVSSTPWADNSHQAPHASTTKNERIKPFVENIESTMDSVSQVAPRINTTSPSDDDFDKFQSAVPLSSKSNANFNQMKPQLNPIKDSPSLFSKVDNFTNESVSPNKSLANNMSLLNDASWTAKSKDKSESPFQNSPLQPSPVFAGGMSILQPTQGLLTTSPQNPQSTCQILQPLSLESYSQINWSNSNIDLQDLSSFNPVETLRSLNSELSANSQSKTASPAHSLKGSSQADDDWGEFMSSKPKPAAARGPASLPDDDEWTDFVSSPAPAQNGLNTISLNVHTNLNMQKTSSHTKANQLQVDIPSLSYITPKTNQNSYSNRHFQNL